LVKLLILGERRLSRTEVYAGVSTLLVIVLLMLSFTAEPVSAYSSGSGGTHHFIFEQAKSILQNDGYKSFADFLNSTEPSSGLTYLQIMIKGSDENDGLIAAREHYMDPMDHQGLFLITYQKSAGTLCQERFSEAVTQWKNGNYSQAMYNLGWATHLVQDLCVPHHAWTKVLDWHSYYESWANENKALLAVSSRGIYNFSSFPDLQYYLPAHYSWSNTSAYDWVDYCAHESITQFLLVNSYYGTNVTDSADPYIETIHPLPNDLKTARIITSYGASMMQLHFEKIDTENGSDYICIYDKHDNLLDAYTGKHEDIWTPWYSTADTLKIKVTTNPSNQSWGYKINEVRYHDLGENVTQAANALLTLAQRATAGFIKFFFDKVLNPLTGDLNNDGKVDILDIVLVAQAFGSYPGHPRWNPICDINISGIVDIVDMVMVAKDYGKAASPQ
jgi:phospholipase C